MQSAKDRALFYLGRLARTERQVRNYLSRKGYSQGEITEAISYLNEHHYLSDSSFAEAYIRSRIRKLDGPLKIKQLLFQKGIDAQTADSLLKIHYPQELQMEKAKDLADKKSGKPRETLLRLLASRGFPRYVIIGVLSKR